jgi:hypothetical protein
MKLQAGIKMILRLGGNFTKLPYQFSSNCPTNVYKGVYEK